MTDNKVSDVLAQAFAAEGVDTLFTLMGDANMYWSASMADNQKIRLVHARHEHCCVAMADAYARATGKVGVGSVTCGPGYTQIMTALATRRDASGQIIDTSIVRVHQHGACIIGNGKQSMDRSRGGLTTKIHAVVDSKGLPVRLAIRPTTTGSPQSSCPV